MIVLACEADASTVAAQATLQRMDGTGWAWIHIDASTVPKTGTEGWLSFRPQVAIDAIETFASNVRSSSELDFNVTLGADEMDISFMAELYDAVMLYCTRTLQQRS